MLKKRIPTFVGILLLLIGITAGVYLVEFGSNSLVTKAVPEATPKNVSISNLTDASFTVTWITDTPSLGLVKYSKRANDLNLSGLDDRDQIDNNNRSYTTHYVTLSGLMPETTYYFNIVSETESSTFDNNGQPYSVTTGVKINTSPQSDTSYGMVYYADNSPVEDAIVYVDVASGNTLSSLTGNSGTWAVPLSAVRTSDLASYLNYDKESSILTIEVIAPDGNKANVTTTTAFDSPVDDIYIGETHDFTAKDEKIEEKLEEKESQFSLETIAQEPEIQSEVTIDNIEEGESVNTMQPEFIGEGPPGANIEAVLESDEPIEGQIIVDDSGSWSWSPRSLLDPGEHKLTLSWIDENGIKQSIIRSFVVYAQGESNLPSFEATPSATPTEEPTPTPSPSLFPSPTATPTATPTAIPTPTTPQATEPSLPTPGTGNFSFLIVLLGISMVVSGFAIYYRKNLS